MSAFRIVFNRLPDAILNRVLQVGSIQSSDPEWHLLRSGNTRRTFRFTPADGGPAWVVKWGFRSHTSLKKIGNTLRGRDAATVEWQLTRQAGDRGVDVLEFELVGVPRIFRGSFQTLLVTRYLDDTCNMLDYLAHHWDDEARIEHVLKKLADQIAIIHQAGLLHQDLSLDNILVCGNDAERVIVIDWFKSFEAPKGKTDRYFVEFLAPLSDMIYAGLPDQYLRIFLQHYSRSMPWCESEIDALIEAAWKIRVSVCRRAYRNCTRRSRRLIQYRSHGYRVFQFKEADRSQIEGGLAAPMHTETILIGKPESPKGSVRLNLWRMANLLHMTGIKGHCVAAYAIQKKWLKSKSNT